MGEREREWTGEMQYDLWAVLRAPWLHGLTVLVFKEPLFYLIMAPKHKSSN